MALQRTITLPRFARRVLAAERHNVGRTKMRIERDDAQIPWNQVAALFAAVGWGARDPDDVRAAFGRSTFKAFAFDAEELVGFGRTIDDGKFYATIVDVVVSPAYRRKGAGRAIVEDIQKRLNGFLVVTLTAAADIQPFYRKLGWRSLATGMIRPRSAEQARLNCRPEETE
jgi:ribosomal protein S18 acetylase RimI-like enzyme